MEKCVFSQDSEELINKELGITYHGFKGTTMVEIYRGRRTIQVPVNGYRLEAQVYLAKDPRKKTIMSLDFGYVATRSNKIAYLVSKLKNKPFASVEQLAKIVSIASREERGAFMRQAQINYRYPQGQPSITPKKEWLEELEKIQPTQMKEEK